MDTEFTGLHKETTLMSIGLVTEHGHAFYAELTDYSVAQVDEWIEENVLDNFILQDEPHAPIMKFYDKDHPLLKSCQLVRGTKEDVGTHLSKWLKYQVDKRYSKPNEQYTQIELWSDCYAYDIVLFNDLWGHAFLVPEEVFYIPFDLSTMLMLYGIDEDCDRERFSEIGEKNTMNQSVQKHNALWDALVIRECYNKLTGAEVYDDI